MYNLEFVQRIAIKNNSFNQFNSQLRDVGKRFDSFDS